MEENMEKRAVRLFVFLKIFETACLGFIVTTYVPFLLDHGLDLFQATQVNIAFMLVNTILDPLTGSLADKIGQRRTYFLGFLFIGIGTFVYGFGSGFWAFVLAECVSAVGVALWSEALESWIRSLCGKEIAHKAITKAGLISKSLSVVFGFAGAFAAARFGLEIPWFLGGAFAFAALFLGPLFSRNLPDATNHSTESRGSIRESLKLFLRVPQLRFVAVVTFVCSISFQALNMFWSPVFREMAGSVSWLGFIWAGVAVCISFGYFVAGKITKPNKVTIGVSIQLIGIPIFLSALFFGENLLVLVTGFLLHEISRAALFPFLFSYSNDFIPDGIRATTNSIRGSFRTVGAIVGLFISGLLTEYITPIQVWVISGALLIVLSIWIFFYQIFNEHKL